MRGSSRKQFSQIWLHSRFGKVFKKNPTIFAGYLTGTYYKNMAIWKFFPFKIWRIWAEIWRKTLDHVCVCV
jgi:hypothetical protein